jgi:hypothetical protein
MKWSTLRIFKKILLRIALAFGTCHSRTNPPRHQSYGKSQIPTEIAQIIKKRLLLAPKPI